KTMRVLGIDPAAAGPTGYGVVETDGRNCWMLRFGALPALAKNRRDDFPARLRQIHGLVARLIDEFSPDSVALESVFTALNIQTAQSQARFAAAGATPAGLPQAGRAQTHPGISAARNRPAAGRILTR